MQIKTLMKLALISSISLSVALGLIVFLSFLRVEESERREHAAGEIVQAVFEQGVLVSDYLLHPQERSYEQWIIRRESLTQLLREADGRFKNSESQNLLAAINMRLESNDAVFSDLTTTLDTLDNNPQTDTVSQARIDGFATTLSLNLLNMSSNASRLVEISIAEAASAQKVSVFLAGSLLILFGSVVIAIFYLINKKVLAPIALLQKGTEIVGRGDLDHRAGLKARDEIGSLSRAFDNMTGNLQATMASRDELEEEIAERKEAEEQLRQAIEREVLHVQQTPLGVIEWNLNFNVAAWNPAAEKIFGYYESEAMGKHASFIIPESFKDHVDQIWEALVSRKGGGRSTNENVRKDGTTIHCEWFNTPLVDVHGIVIAVTSLVQDITDEVRNRAALEKAHEELLLTQEQVIRQERLSALGTMASGIAHDFNNALAPILGFAELLLDGPNTFDDREKAQHYLQRINTSARDATEVVDRLRDFYRHREQADLLIPVDLNKVISEVVSVTEPRWRDMAQAAGINISVNLELTRDAVLTSGNDSELRTAITNLVFNAVDAMPEGGIITISTYSDSDIVKVVVKDNGTGMPEEVMKRAMEPFFTTKNDGGTGLGLAMVYGIITRHTGTIEIQSKMGQGTSVILSLPVRHANESNESNESNEAEQTVSKVSVRPLHVLAVDDEPLMLEVLTEYLGGDGHTVKTAFNGAEALEHFRRGNFDLALIDRAMPDMNGDQLAINLKAVSPHVPVVMLTGFGRMMEAAEELPGGVDLILRKPVTLAALRNAMNKLFSN